MKVYVVTEGTYSDYGIIGVTLDKDIADRIVEINNLRWRWGDARIEEYETDKAEPLRDKNPYWVDVCYDKISCTLCGALVDKPYEVKEQEIINPKTHGKWRHYMVGVYAKDEEHAKKIALDKIAEYRAEKEGIKV